MNLFIICISSLWRNNFSNYPLWIYYRFSFTLSNIYGNSWYIIIYSTIIRYIKVIIPSSSLLIWRRCFNYPIWFPMFFKFLKPFRRFNSPTTCSFLLRCSFLNFLRSRTFILIPCTPTYTDVSCISIFGFLVFLGVSSFFFFCSLIFASLLLLVFYYDNNR